MCGGGGGWVGFMWDPPWPIYDMFAFLHTNPLLKRVYSKGSTLNGKSLLLKGIKFFPFQKGGQTTLPELTPLKVYHNKYQVDTVVGSSGLVA